MTQTLTRRVEDAFELVGQVLLAALAGGEARRLGRAHAQEAVADALAPRAVAHDHEVPRLRVAHRRRLVRGGEDALEDVVAERRAGAKVADVAALADDVVDGAAIVVREAHGRTAVPRLDEA